MKGFITHSGLVFLISGQNTKTEKVKIGKGWKTKKNTYNLFKSEKSKQIIEIKINGTEEYLSTMNCIKII